MRGAIVMMGVLAVSLGDRVARATELDGRVVVRGNLARPPETASPRAPFYWSLDNGVLPARADRILPERDLAIVLAERGRPPARRAGEPLVVRIAEGGMQPAVVVVRPGTLLRFENDDTFEHELYSPSHPAFAAERLVRGQTRTFVAPQSGQVEVRCRRSPHMRGWIAVLDAAYVVTPRWDGAFTLTAEPGLYTVRTFFEGRWLADSELLVEDARTQTVEIVVDAAAARPAAPPAAAPPQTPPPAGAVPPPIQAPR